jgi:hypothetical protein
MQRLLDSLGVSGVEVTLAKGRLSKLVYRDTAPRDGPYRAIFALPGFLVVDSAGHVASRAAGVSLDPARRLEHTRASLDSLLHAVPAVHGAPAATI